MSATLTRSVLTVSIDLEFDGGRPATTDRRAIDDAVERMAQLLARHQLRATWVVADPAASLAARRIVRGTAGHEIALWGDVSWVGPSAGRTHFARELSRRVAAARDQGLAITTLAVSEVHFERHAELAIKHGLTVVRRGVAPARSSSPATRPLTLRYGLWSFPVTCALPGKSRLWPGGGGRAVRALVDQAIADRRLVHLAIDAPRLAECGPSAERVLDQVLAHAQWRRNEGVLDVTTIAAAAAILAGKCQTTPSRSILRPAA